MRATASPGSAIRIHRGQREDACAHVHDDDDDALVGSIDMLAPAVSFHLDKCIHESCMHPCRARVLNFTILYSRRVPVLMMVVGEHAACAGGLSSSFCGIKDQGSSITGP